MNQQTNNQKGWEERFDEQFYDLGTAGYLIGTESISINNGEKLKSFISLLLEEKAEKIANIQVDLCENSQEFRKEVLSILQ